MSSFTRLEQMAAKDELSQDLYSLVKFLDENLSAPVVFYFERPEKGFVRPSLQIKFVEFTNVARNDYWSEMDIAVHVQYFTEDVLDANYMAHLITKLLSGHGVGVKDVILPRYDFTTTPPEKIPVSAVDADGNPAGGAMGVRVDPDSVSASPAQEVDGLWNVPITFSMRSPRIANRCFTPLEAIHITRIGPFVTIPTQIVEAGVSSTAFVEATLR